MHQKKLAPKRGIHRSMKLKSITIHGFKSFADRTVIQYHKGITGVIGPNGSGKSNVIDAVRWVMGEQTAKSLRADDPTDIIFAGSQSRKHMGTATVKLTFLNDGNGCPPEFLHLEEISIERRINRSGEREYFMNSESCRLRDIVDFLLSIGLGSKSYSIIAQEKRDRIIQANPEEMREILEEAAGISAFKNKRKEAEKRLESTAEKLKSLEQLETELTHQLQSLEEQVKAATLKMSLQQDLQFREISILKDRVGFLRSHQTLVEEELQKQKTFAETKLLESAQLESQANEHKSQQMELMVEIDRLRNLWDDKRIALTKVRERLENREYHRKERQIILKNLQTQFQEDKDSFEQEEQHLETHQKNLQDSEVELAQLDGVLESLNQEWEIQEERFLVEKSQCDELRYQLNATQTSLITLLTQNENTLQQIEKFHLQSQKNETLRKLLLDQRLEQVEHLQKISQVQDGSQCGLDSKIAQKASLQQQLSELEPALQKLLEQRDAQKSKLVQTMASVQSLQKIVDSGAQSSQGSQALRQKFPNAFSGFVFEKIKAHPQDEPILEKALPELLEAAIVEDFDGLLFLLDKAEEQDFSRIQLLSQDFMAPLLANEKAALTEILKIPGVRWVADRLAPETPEHVKHLFNRVLIAPDEWIARKVLKQLGPEAPAFWILTERGSLCAWHRPIAFGKQAHGANEGLLHLRREWEEHKSKLTQHQDLLGEWEARLYKLQQTKSQLQASLAEMETQLSQETMENLKISSQMENLHQKISGIDSQLQKWQEDQNELQAEWDLLKSKYDNASKNIHQLEMEKNRTQKELLLKEEDMSHARDVKEETMGSVNRTKSERNILKERQHHFRISYEQQKLNIKRIQERLDRTMAQITSQNTAAEKTDEEEEQFRSEILFLEREVEHLKESLDEKREEEAQEEEMARVIENKLKNIRDKANSEQKFITEKSSQLMQIKTLLELALRDAWEKYKLGPSQLPSQGEDNPAQLKMWEQEIKEIHEALQTIGPVNERALEERNEVRERTDFLLQQKDDIVKSTEELRKSIFDIEELTKTRFQEIYVQVNQHFQDTFPILFPGGNAQLNLLNPADLLTTGVEILVQLPGKKQQNMALFSGGEKALTAISLIFSLLKTTPAPFCFLDEVDAPLDEANVGRFNTILSALSSEFQFVVITHNRRTMEVLDTIYGISMSEPGVSKIVSVDLSEASPTLKKLANPAGNRERPGATAHH